MPDILTGVTDILDNWLGIAGNPHYGVADSPKFKSKQAGIDLHDNHGLFNNAHQPRFFLEAIAQAIHEIEANCLVQRQTRCAG